MYLTFSEEALAFLYSGLFGGILGVLYDTVRQGQTPRRKVFSACMDAVFVLISCLMLIWFVLTVLNGQMRLFALLGIGLGWMLYACTLSPTVRSVLNVFSRALRWLGRKIHRVFRGVYHAFRRIGKRVLDGHRKKTKKQKGEVLWQREEKNGSVSSRN